MWAEFPDGRIRMHKTTPDRGLTARLRGRRPSVRIWALIGVLLVIGLTSAWVATSEPVEPIRYGRFKKLLADGEFRYARVAPTDQPLRRADRPDQGPADRGLGGPGQPQPGGVRVGDPPAGGRAGPGQGGRGPDRRLTGGPARP